MVTATVMMVSERLSIWRHVFVSCSFLRSHGMNVGRWFQMVQDSGKEIFKWKNVLWEASAKNKFFMSLLVWQWITNVLKRPPSDCFYDWHKWRFNGQCVTHLFRSTVCYPRQVYGHVKQEWFTDYIESFSSTTSYNNSWWLFLLSFFLLR